MFGAAPLPVGDRSARTRLAFPRPGPLLLRYTRLLPTQAVRRWTHDRLGDGLGVEPCALGAQPEASTWNIVSTGEET